MKQIRKKYDHIRREAKAMCKQKAKNHLEQELREIEKSRNSKEIRKTTTQKDFVVKDVKKISKLYRNREL